MTGGSPARGLSLYQNELYWCDFNNDKLVKGSTDGSTTAVDVDVTFDDGGMNDGCMDVHFYVGKISRMTDVWMYMSMLVRYHK